MFHKSVLSREVLHFLGPEADKHYVDATVGTGGHSETILRQTSPAGIVVGFERDQKACEMALERLGVFGERFRLIEDNFVGVEIAKARLGEGVFDGVLYDLGVSSIQLDDPQRGFSFLKDGPLDMRMDVSQEMTVEKIVNERSEEDLANIFLNFGEERFGREMARSIIRERGKRRIMTTCELASIVSESIPKKFLKRSIHPATKAFMALRIFINDELANLEVGLEKSLGILKQGARIVAISFHSLEDRIVKNFFRAKSKACTCPRSIPKCVCGGKSLLRILTKKPVLPAREETERNPRARSAKLRAAEVL